MKHTSEEIKNRLSNIGEAIGNIALDYIADLEKENTELKETLKGKRCNCMTYLNFKDLEREIAELKKQLVEKGQHLDLTEREWGKDMSKMIHYRTQATKAKEIISELLSSCFGYNSKTVNYEVKTKAEQFLKEE